MKLINIGYSDACLLMLCGIGSKEKQPIGSPKVAPFSYLSYIGGPKIM